MLTDSDVEARNKATEAEELIRWETKPDKSCGYLKFEDGIAGNYGKVTTWMGTPIGQIYWVRRYRSLGHKMASIRMRGTNGASYWGKFGEDWSEFVRLRKMR